MRQEKKGSPDASPSLKLILHAGCNPVRKSPQPPSG
jgi:hypothetical protein